jgi:hypothetical protein
LDNGQLYCITLWAGVYSPQLTIALATTIANYQSKVVYDTKESRSSVINTQSNLHDNILCPNNNATSHCCTALLYLEKNKYSSLDEILDLVHS